MIIQEARNLLNTFYISQGLLGSFPKPIIGVSVSNYMGDEVLRIDINIKSFNFIPNEAKSGIGYEGFRCVAFRGVINLISDSGVV